MLVSKTVTINWNSKIKKHYVDLGYVYTKMRDPVEVDVADLTDGSNAIVKVRCDYCGRIFERAWYTHVLIGKREAIHMDCCGNIDCLQKKAKESVNEKYGGYSEMFEAANGKRSETILRKYGCRNPFSNEDIKRKIVETNIMKYGVPYSQQNPVVHNKTISTCREKYGVDHYVELFRGVLIRENSPHWKGGVRYSRVERATYEYRQWRTSVFYKDAYRCRKCGATNGIGNGCVELNAHHIMNWKDNPDLRYDVNNGITLCSECHMKFHSIYGKRLNTREQLEQFLHTDKNLS